MVAQNREALHPLEFLDINHTWSTGPREIIEGSHGTAPVYLRNSFSWYTNWGPPQSIVLALPGNRSTRQSSLNFINRSVADLIR